MDRIARVERAGGGGPVEDHEVPAGVVQQPGELQAAGARTDHADVARPVGIGGGGGGATAGEGGAAQPHHHRRSAKTEPYNPTTNPKPYGRPVKFF